MSFPTTGHHSNYPITTTTTTDTTAITNTSAATVTTTTTTTPPRMVTLPPGGHAGALGLDWQIPDDRAKYLATTGLPLIHAAVINDDWNLAETLLTAENIGKAWQFDPRGEPRWEKALLDPDMQIKKLEQEHEGNLAIVDKLKLQHDQKLAIIDMSFALVDGSTVKNAGCLHGANLLTLCLKKHAPTVFLKQLIASLKAHAPESLNHPDPSGRTPLYVAAEHGDKDQVMLLLAEGADPLAKCHFQQNDHPRDMPTALAAAVSNRHEEIFEILLRQSTDATAWHKHYESGDDALCLFKWVDCHHQDEVLALAGKFPDLKSYLLNADDQSGTSEIFRCISRGQWPDTYFHPLGRSKLDKTPLFVAAACGHADLFYRMLKMCLDKDSVDLDPAETKKLLSTFLTKNSDEQMARLPDQWPGIERSLCATVVNFEFLGEISVNFQKYSAIIRMAWPLMDHGEQNHIHLDTANREARHLELVMSLGGRPAASYHWEIYTIIAATNHKTELFELAETYASSVKNALETFESNKESPVPFGVLTQILRARSATLFGAFIQSGLSVQALLDKDNDYYLPLMADCNPAHLQVWLRGCHFTVSANAIANIRTEAGLAALLALEPPKEGESAGKDSEKTNA